jgi:hypothetical protein
MCSIQLRDVSTFWVLAQPPEVETSQSKPVAELQIFDQFVVSISMPPNLAPVEADAANARLPKGCPDEVLFGNNGIVDDFLPQ